MNPPITESVNNGKIVTFIKCASECVLKIRPKDRPETGVCRNGVRIYQRGDMRIATLGCTGFFSRRIKAEMG